MKKFGMSVILETSVGDLTIDLLVDECPLIAQNFLKLCKLKYYNNTLFHQVERDFVAVGGMEKGEYDTPTNTPTVWGLIDQVFTGCYDNLPEDHFVNALKDEISSQIKHDRIGVVATANEKHNQNGASFYITLGENIQSLDGRHTIFGYVVEGVDEVLIAKINKATVDQKCRPLQNIRIRHTLIVDDPFDDPPFFNRVLRSRSPTPIKDIKLKHVIKPEDELKILEKISQNEARSRAIALEILGDIPDAEMKPPDNVLFICKLNPYTESEDLETIFRQ